LSGQKKETEEGDRMFYRSNGFLELQRRYWDNADVTRFAWQTRNRVMAPTEAALVERVAPRPGERLLEIGCGEGANLHHLRAGGAIRFGVDFSRAKTAFARRATEAHTVTADAARLPFADGSFDAVLIRDVLHHVGAPAAVLAEARRVLRPTGRLTLLEPNATSFAIFFQATLISAERHLFKSTRGRLRKLITAAGFTIEREAADHPFPLDRLLLHPKMGMPALAQLPLVEHALRLVDVVARRLLPPRVWMYLVFEAVPKVAMSKGERS
jgi:ubiquinone/menaquinone biosynthesis C-methylase UbiE